MSTTCRGNLATRARSRLPCRPGWAEHPAPRGSTSSLRAAGTIGEEGKTGNLQSLVLDQVVCPAPENAPADYLDYFPTLAAGSPDSISRGGPGPDQPAYMCVQAAFDPGGSESPLKADIAVDKDGKHIAFHDGGLSSIPDSVQLTLSKYVTTSTATDAFRTPCGPAWPAQTHPDCLPPLVRLDTTTDATLAGVFELGTVDDLKAIDGMVPNGKLTKLDAVPPLVLPANPADNLWSDWTDPPNPADPLNNPGGHGARVRMASFKNRTDTESRTAVKAGLRLAVPKSFTLDQVQTWNGVGPEGSDEESGDESKDIKFHYTVRDGGGAVVKTIGEAAAMINLAGGKQILLSGEDNAFIRGLSIPGDLSLDVYLRHHKRHDDTSTGEDGGDVVDKLFAQIDGRVNKSISARVRVSGGGSVLNALVQDVPSLPAFEPGDASNDPSFRLRFEMDSNKEPASLPSGGLACFFICINTEVHPAEISATMDFSPDNNEGTAARRVDAFIDMDAPRAAIDINAFANIDPNDRSPAEISGSASVYLDPFAVFIHAEFFLIGANVGLASDLRAGATIDHASRFRATSNLLHLKADAEGAGTSHIDIDFRPQVLAGEVHSIVGAFFGVPLLYAFMFTPPSLPPPVPGGLPNSAAVSFGVCPVPGITTDVNRLRVVGGADPLNLYAFLDPQVEQRFISWGVFGIDKFVDILIGPPFCGNDADLIDGIPHQPYLTDSHKVPPVVPIPLSPVPATEPPPNPLNVAAGPPLEMCGDHSYDSVTIDAMATLQVADVAGALCPAADVGTLRLVSQRETTINGAVLGAPNSTQPIGLSGATIHLSSTGQIVASRGPDPHVRERRPQDRRRRSRDRRARVDQHGWWWRCRR